MAADTAMEDVQLSSCCQVWKNKYSKAEKGRVLLKQAVHLLEKGCDSIQSQNLTLKKAYEDEHARTKVEMEGREKELALRVSLENQLSVLNSEMSNLKQKGVSDAENKTDEGIKLLKASLSDREKEINWLKELVEKEKNRADMEMKKAAEASKRAETENIKAGLEQRLADIERKKAEDYRTQLEHLRKEVSEAKSKLVSEKSKFDEATKKLQEEKKKADEERKCADLEMAKAKEHMRIAEETKKTAVDERKRANLEMAEAEEQRKIVEETKKKAVDERKCADSEMAEAEDLRKIAEEIKKKAVDEKTRANFEMAKAEEQKKIADETKKKAVEERTHANLEMAEAEEQRKIAEQNMKKAAEVRKHADFEMAEAEEQRKIAEENTKKAAEVKKHADFEMAKAEEQKKIADETKKKAVEERTRADLEMAKAEEQKKIADETKKKAVEERTHANLEMAEAEEQRKIAEENTKKAAEVRKHADFEMAKAEEQKKIADETKKKAVEERTRVDLEMAEAEEQRKIAEQNMKMAAEVRKHAGFEMVEAEEQRKIAEENTKKVAEVSKCANFEMAKAEEQKKIADETKKKADEERTHADLEMAEAEEQRKIAKQNMKKAAEVRKHACFEIAEPEKQRKIGEENTKKAAEVRKCANFEMAKAEEKRKTAEETKKAVEDRKRAVVEMAKVEEQRKIAVEAKKKAVEEKSHDNNLAKQLEEARRRNEELEKKLHELSRSRNLGEGPFDQPDRNTSAAAAKSKKTEQLDVLKEDAEKSRAVSEPLQFEEVEKKKAISERKQADSKMRRAEKKRKLVDVNTKKAIEGKHCCDHLSKLLEDARLKINELQKQMHELSFSRKMVGSLVVSSAEGTSAEVAEVKLLKKQLKFEKKRVKYAKDVARLEKSRSNLLQQELGCMKLELIQILSRLDTLDKCFSTPDEGIDDMEEERGAFSVTTSAKLGEENLNLQPTISSMSGEVTKNRCNGNFAGVAENCVRSSLPVGPLQRVNGRVRKRKMILDAVESIELLCCESKKLHLQLEDKLSVLDYMVKGQTDKPREEAKLVRSNLQDLAYAVHDRSCKRRKTSHEETVAMEQSCDGLQMKQMHSCPEHLCNPDAIDPKIMVGFEEVVNENYMKLLDLDNAAEEECYRMAAEIPVSPTLPEIEFRGIKTFEVDQFGPVQDENCERFSQNENSSSDSFDVMNVENGCNKLQCNRIETSPKLLQYENRCSFDIRRSNENGFCCTMQAERACLSHSHNSGVEVEMSVVPSSGDGVANIPSEIGIISTFESIPKFCVMFSNIKDGSSVSRIFSATKTCMAQCSLPAQTEFAVHRILHALKLEEKLLSEEKVCVFLSLVLLNFCIATSGNCSLIRDFIPCLNLFAEHMNEVMSDAEPRSVVAEICLEELLSIIEDFLVEGRVMLYTSLSSETSVECDSRIHVIIDGSDVIYTHEAAPADLLVAEAIATRSSVADVLPQFHACVGCLFSKNVLSVDVVVSLLFARLQNYAQSGIMHQDLTANSSNSNVKSTEDKVEQDLSCVVDMNCNVSCCLDKCSLPVKKSGAVVTGILCDISDVISLMELLACNMGWEWTCKKIIAQLWSMLESSVLENLTIAIIILLGQLGRLGVDDVGCEDKEVENLRVKLSALLWQDTTIKAGLPIQLATVTALVGLQSLDFEKAILENVKLPVMSGQFFPADLMRNWFALLTE
ncbi:hypothetical protein REPUB_Repub14bG0002100 [Reevesia pubescens]